MPKKVTNAKIACLDFSLQKAKMALGVSVVVEDPDKLEAIRKRWVHSVQMDNSSYRLNFDRGKKYETITIAGTSILK
jgi:T-complex protein 1 subunit alpha